MTGNKRRDAVAIIILNMNGYVDTLLCINSLLNCTHTNYSVTIVDNGSTDGSVDKIIHFLLHDLRLSATSRSSDLIDGQISACILRFSGPLSVTIISVDENLGVSGGRNVGAGWVLLNGIADYFFFLDNDAQIEPNTISVCIALSRKTGAAVVGCLIKNSDGSLQYSGLSFYKNIFYLDVLFGLSLYDASKEYWATDFVPGCGMLVARHGIEAVLRRRRYLFADYFLYAEDQEFALAARQCGMKVILARDAVVYHRISRGGAGLRIAYYYSSRNRIYLANDFLPIGLKVLFHLFYPVFRLVRACHNLIIGGAASVSLAHLQGLFDGYRGIKGKWKKQP